MKRILKKGRRKQIILPGGRQTIYLKGELRTDAHRLADMHMISVYKVLQQACEVGINMMMREG